MGRNDLKAKIRLEGEGRSTWRGCYHLVRSGTELVEQLKLCRAKGAVVCVQPVEADER